MRNLMIILCSLMLFSACRSEKEAKGGGTNQTGEGAASGTQAGAVPDTTKVAGDATSYTVVLDSKSAEGENLAHLDDGKAMVFFQVKKDGKVNKVNNSSFLHDGACVELNKEDFPYFSVVINKAGNHVYGCGPGQDISACFPKAGNWSLSLVGDCNIAYCNYKWERESLGAQTATNCLKLREVSKRAPSS